MRAVVRSVRTVVEGGGVCNMRVRAVCVRTAIEELTPGMTLRMVVLWVVWWEGARRDRMVSLATELSRMRSVGCDVGVISRARQAARFSPVLLEDGEFPIVGGRSLLIAKYGIIG